MAVAILVVPTSIYSAISICSFSDGNKKLPFFKSELPRPTLVIPLEQISNCELKHLVCNAVSAP
jgi:hypothetical protein